MTKSNLAQPSNHGVRGLPDSTRQFYETQAAAYAQSTLNAQMTAVYDRFLARVPAGARILDAGCGSGRDLAAFKARGYLPTGIDASAALVQLAAQHSNAPCWQMDLTQLAFQGCFEAVWACASLLHLPRHKLLPVLKRLHAALTQGGTLYVSLKAGVGAVTGADGRYFVLYGRDELVQTLQGAGFAVCEVWDSSSVLPGQAAAWLNVIARQQQSPRPDG